MKLASFYVGKTKTLGLVAGGNIVDLSRAAPDLPNDMRAFFEAGPSALKRLKEVAARAADIHPLETVRLAAPIENPSKFLAIGMNYKEHADRAARAGITVPSTQLWFNKQVSCIQAPYGDVVMPRVSDKLDYEAELGFVIARRCRHVRAEDAMSVIGGYFVANDVSVRDWQHRSPTYTLGKSFDTHGPIGPWITLADEIPDPHALRMTLSVNGEIRQDSSTGDMIYRIPEQIAYLTTVMTLEPGDIVLTGTPHGTGIEYGKYLCVGDIVRVEIEGLGFIENKIVAETA